MRIRTLLILGIAVREAFSFWTGHPFDFEIWVRAGYWVPRGFSPYAPLPPAPGLTFANPFAGSLHAAIGYLPLWPILLGAIYDLYALVGSGNRFVYYFMLKQPIIIGDVLVAFLLFLYVRRQNPDMAPKVMALWLFSPFTIILSAMWGIFDSMAMAGVMLALLAPQGRARSAWEGLATLMKSIPVLFIQPLSYSREKRLTNFFVALGIPVIFTLIVVFVEGWPVINQEYTVSATLENTLHVWGFPLSLWGTWVYLNTQHVVSNATFHGVLDGGGEWVWIPACAIMSLLARRWFGSGNDQRVVQSLLLVYLTFLLVRGQVNEQYAIYLLALLLIDASLWNPKRMKLFYAVSVVITAAVVTNNILLLRFVSPVFPGVQQLETQLIGQIDPFRNGALFVEGIAFCALNLLYLASLIRERRRGFEL